MRSIRSRLATRLGAAAFIVLITGGGGLYFSLREALEKQFDDVLVARTGALIMASEFEDGELEIDLDVQTFAGFGMGARGEYFAVFDENGEAMLRSPSLESDDLSLPPKLAQTGEGFSRILLPEDVRGRAFWTTYEPSMENEGPAGEVTPNLKIIVASSDATLRRTLRTVAIFTSIFGSIGVILTLVISKSVVRSGLKSLDQMSEEVEKIDVRHLALRVPTQSVPSELRGMGAKINELLARLEDSFEREKRFSSNAAHELRTPLAELRTMTELGTRWPEEFTEEHGSEMLDVISELEELLGTLSLLGRAESEASAKRDLVDLEGVVGEQIERVLPRMEERGIEIEKMVEKGEFHSDPVLFRAILQNLLDNAVAYSPKESVIQLRVGPDYLEVENETTDLEEGDLSQLFARFWRKSQSRSEKGHSGLGLSVVRASVEHLGGFCRAELNGSRLLVGVRWVS